MDRDDTNRPDWRRLPRRLVAGLLAGLPLLGVACSVIPLTAPYPEMPSPAPVGPPPPPAPVVQAAQYAPPADARPREVPITLDAVFRLAEQQNPRIALAREKLHESLLTQEQKARVWLPNVYAGASYFRHEGGIQDFNGNLVHSSFGSLSPGLTVQGELDLREATFQGIEAQRRVLQDQVSRCQVDNEVLLDAALTYVDLLTARRGEAIALDLEAREQRLLERAENIAKTERGAAGFVEGVRATLSGRRQLLSQLRQQGKASSAKLVYLLGLPPQTVLVPVDPILAPIELVDVSPGPERLVAQAMTQGPCVHELQHIIGVIQLGIEKSDSVHNLLPSLQINAYEGGFGAGPGGNLAWANRLDANVGFRWNLTQLCQSDYLRTTARSKQTQALLNYDELRGKLAAGVLEAAEAIFAGREQIGYSASQIRHAGSNYESTDRRLDAGLQTASPGEVLLSIRALEQAHFNNLSVIAAHNKAQIRLLLLLGGCSAAPTQGVPIPPPQIPPAPTPTPRILPAPADVRATNLGGVDQR